MADYLIVDTETGGLIPGRHSLLEVGLAAYRGGEVIGRKQFYIQEEEYLVTPKAMEINKLDLAEVYKQGVGPYIAMLRIIDFVKLHFGEEKPKMLGQNVRFDREYIKHLFMRNNYNIDDYIHYRVMDVQVLAQAAKDIGYLPEEASTGLHKLAPFLGYQPQGAHTAMGDIETTVFVYEELLDIFKEAKPWQTDSTTE